MSKEKDLEKAKNSNFIAAVDIGSSSIVTIIAERSYDDHLTLLGWGIAASKGINTGSIVNRDAAVGSILESVSEAEKMADVRVSEVCVSISAANVSSVHSVASCEVVNHEILEEDIDYVVEQAGSSVKKSHQHVLHLLPQSFSVDGRVGVGEPLHMTGDVLQANVHVILARKTIVKSLVKLVQKSGLVVQDVVLSSLASSYSSLTEQAKSLGVCQIDLGENVTSYCVFVDGMIRDTGVVDIGTLNIISDVAEVLHIDIEEAESLYYKYGKALSSMSRVEEVFELETCADEKNFHKKLSSATLSAIIEARLEELFEIIRQRLVAKELYLQLKAGAILTGGGALLPGVSHLANQVLDLTVKISNGSFVQGVPGHLQSPLFSCALGLLIYTLQSRLDGVGSTESSQVVVGKDPIFKRFFGAVQGIFT